LETNLKQVAVGLKHALIALTATVLVGCGGGGSGGGDAAAQGGGVTPPPSLSLTANPTSVASGAASMLSWTSTNATSCSASGAWSGNKSTSGNFQTAALTTDSTFTLSCNGAGGGVVARATVAVTPVNANTPTAQLSASPLGVPLNGSTTLTWTTENVTSCTASWSGSAPPLDGAATVGPIAQDQTYTLSCSGPNGNAVAMVSFGVRRAVLTWTAPTQNVDGSALTDLAGFKVYWGTSSRSYGNSATVNGAGANSYAIDLAAPGTYYFAVSAFNAASEESTRSNEVTKSVL
jgi:hypothetical protein